MLELEFLGIQPDGNHMTLNDSDGNRYSLPITDELRASLRRDRAVSPADDPKPMSPKDIQAHFRAGRSLEELSDMTLMPASQLSPYEYPILAEREYTASQARAYRIGHEIGSLTVEELVTSRLASRDVDPRHIEWSAARQPGKPWMLTASYTVAGRDTSAVWTINQETHSLFAENDEARWLSETEIPVKDSPWRPLAAAAPTGDEKATASEEPDADRIVSMLDSLSARRGTKQPMTFEDDEDYPPAAHPPASQPDEATDATVLSLPPRPDRARRSEESSQSAPSAPSPVAETDPEKVSETDSPEGEADDALIAQPVPKPVKRRRSGNRPAMPSWDEIVFGQPKD